MHTYPVKHIDIHDYDHDALKAIRDDFGKKSMASTINMLLNVLDDYWYTKTGEGYFTARPEDNGQKRCIARRLAIQPRH